MSVWFPPWAHALVSGPRGRTSLDVPPHGAKSSLDDDVPTPRLRRGAEPVTGGVVSDDSHPPLRCEPTMTIQRISTPYVSGYGESAVPTLSASEQSSVDESERTLHGVRDGLHMEARSRGGAPCRSGARPGRLKCSFAHVNGRSLTST